MTGLFFGSFNPIHNGHLKIAQYLLYKGYCQRIWFVVSPHNPLKSDRSLLDEQKRLEIVKAAIRGDERMQACDVEFGLPKPSDTYATLQLLKKKWPEEEFALIIGVAHIGKRNDTEAHTYMWQQAEACNNILKI